MKIVVCDQAGARARFAAAYGRHPASGSRKPISATRSTSRMPTRSKRACSSRRSTAAKWWCCAPARPRAAQTIREALAKGADRAIHIEEENLGSVRSAGRWRACWRRRSQPEKPDLVLTGLQSDDLGYGQTGVILAEVLGLPHATIIMQVEKQDERHPREARAGRRLVPACGDAAAGAADHPIRHQQAALRHADGNQEGQDQGESSG